MGNDWTLSEACLLGYTFVVIPRTGENRVLKARGSDRHTNRTTIQYGTTILTCKSQHHPSRQGEVDGRPGGIPASLEK
jgi:hypothetical protein